MKTPKIIESLAEKIMEAHKKRVAEDSMQNTLKKICEIPKKRFQILYLVWSKES